MPEPIHAAIAFVRSGVKYSLWTAILFVSVSQARNATLHGTASDQTGARVSGATISLRETGGAAHTVTSDQNGNYSFQQLLPGNYILQASAPGMATEEPLSLSLKPGAQTANLTLPVQVEKQKVEVEGQSGPSISAENVNNASSITLRGDDLQSLGDSQEDLAADLQALAGPSAGPNGGQMFIDGLSLVISSMHLIFIRAIF